MFLYRPTFFSLFFFSMLSSAYGEENENIHSVDGEKDILECPPNTSRQLESAENGFKYVWCETEEGIREGIYKVFYPDWKVYIEGNFCNDKLCDTWLDFFENGNLRTRGLYSKGKPDGDWEYYYENGTLFSFGKYKEGCKFGIWYFFYTTGEKLSKISTDYKTCTLQPMEYYIGEVVYQIKMEKKERRKK